MKKIIRCSAILFIVPLFFIFAVYGAEKNDGARKIPAQKTAKVQNYSIQNDIAFVSVWGSRPDAKKLQGFQRAVLFNARGEVVKKVDIGRDSIYSLDRMIQENKTRGPLFIRMYRK